jgi:hypothetical protein
MTATSQAQQRRARVKAAPGRTNGSAPVPGAMSHREVLESLSGLLLVLFVSLISGTIVSTALPRIIGELHGSQTQYTWVVTATLLTATVTTPIWGRLADLFSKKLLLQISITISSSSARSSAASPRTRPSSSGPGHCKASASAACRRWSRL